MSTNGNQPAHPIGERLTPDGRFMQEPTDGLTKREAFAMAAMQGLVSRAIQPDDAKTVAPTAVAYADALLAALDQEPTP